MPPQYGITAEQLQGRLFSLTKQQPAGRLSIKYMKYEVCRSDFDCFWNSLDIQDGAM